MLAATASQSKIYKFPTTARGRAVNVEERSKVETYKSPDVIFLEESLRKAIRDRVIEIGITKAHAMVRRRKQNMAGRRLSSIYSRDDAGPAISLKELIATAAALDEDPLMAMFEAIKRKLGNRERSQRAYYYRSLEQLRQEVAAQRKGRLRVVDKEFPLLVLMEDRR